VRITLTPFCYGVHRCISYRHYFVYPMKSYSILKFAYSTKETGRPYPQVQKMSRNYEYGALNSIYQLGKFTTDLPTFTPNLECFILHKKAKATDLLSNGLTNNSGFLLTGKFKEVLSAFNFPNMNFIQQRFSMGI
jgi:hypothetical protein